MVVVEVAVEFEEEMEVLLVAEAETTAELVGGPSWWGEVAVAQVEVGAVAAEAEAEAEELVPVDIVLGNDMY
ncbi:hypothetical protein NL676_003037 [Syzygium grande]|nr:hypothetical protein NL676_003037 [Syzygium grande]